MLFFWWVIGQMQIQGSTCHSVWESSTRTMTAAVPHHLPCCDTSFCSRHPRQCALISGILWLVLGQEVFPSATEHPGDFPVSRLCQAVRVKGCTSAPVQLLVQQGQGCCHVLWCGLLSFFQIHLNEVISRVELLLRYCCEPSQRLGPVWAGVSAWERNRGVLPTSWCNGSFVQANVTTVKKEKAKVQVVFSSMEQLSSNPWNMRWCGQR